MVSYHKLKARPGRLPNLPPSSLAQEASKPAKNLWITEATLDSFGEIYSAQFRWSMLKHFKAVSLFYANKLYMNYIWNIFLYLIPSNYFCWFVLIHPAPDRQGIDSGSGPQTVRSFPIGQSWKRVGYPAWWKEEFWSFPVLNFNTLIAKTFHQNSWREHQIHGQIMTNQLSN